MSQVKDYFQQAELSLAAYAGLTTGEPSQSELIGAGMSSIQAAAFASRWRVVEQYNHTEEIPTYDDGGNITGYHTTSNGLSATVFEEVSTGKRFLAIRGTDELLDWGTNIIDIGLLGTAKYHGQYQALSAQVEQWLANGQLRPGFVVSGHSLGGFLGANLALDYPLEVSETYLYNAPGLTGVPGGVALERIANALMPGEPFTLPPLASVHNVVAKWDAVSEVGLSVAPPVTVWIESNANPIHNHSIAMLTDALAIFDLYARLDEKLTVEKIGEILKVTSNDNAITLEESATSLARVFLPGTADIAGDDRGKLWETIEAVKREMLYKNSEGQLTIAGLIGRDTDSLVENAREDIGYRYALKELNPFVVQGLEYQALHNQNGDLDLYAPDRGLNGAMTEAYIEDRAAMLALKNEIWVSDGPAKAFAGDDVEYLDRASNVSVSQHQGHQNRPPSRVVVFGTAGDDLDLNGGDGDDHFYGEAGNDILNGGPGADYLEGGIGLDTYYIDGNDRILDIDGRAQVFRIDVPVTGGSGLWFISDAFGDWYESEDHELAYQYDEQVKELKIFDRGDGEVVTVEDFESGELGIQLDAPQEPERGETLTFNAEDNDMRDADWEKDTDALRGYVEQIEAYRQQIAEISGSDVPEESKAAAIATINEAIAVVETDMAEHMERISVLRGEAGDDVLDAYRLDQELHGGEGKDTLLAFDGGAGPGSGGTVLIGNEGNDLLEGKDAAEVFAGGDGKDDVWAGDGDDNLDGGAEADLLQGAQGADLIVGGEGDDLEFGGAGSDIAYGDKGDDIIYGDTDFLAPVRWHEEDATYWGSGPKATIEFFTREFVHEYKFAAPFTVALPLRDTEGAADYLDGGAGDDYIAGGGGDDLIVGGEGNDSIEGEEGADEIEAGDGNDQVHGDISLWRNESRVYEIAGSPASADRIDGGDGDDLLVGGAGDDVILGGSGNDNLAGDDNVVEIGREGLSVQFVVSTTEEVQQSVGNDVLSGGEGDDLLASWKGDDILDGGPGTDWLFGGEGSDALDGGGGTDTVYGENGDDILNSGADAESDFLFGGKGNDLYRFEMGFGADVVDDEEGSDVIELGAFGNDAVAIARDGGDLLVTTDPDNAVRVAGWFGDNPESIEQFVFEDGAREASWITSRALEVHGSDGDDNLDGLDGFADALYGGGGNDLLNGNSGNDTLDGGAGVNELIGGAGDDTLIARDAGSDNFLFGGSGADTYLLGAGNHTLVEEKDGAVNTVRLEDARETSGIVLVRTGEDAYLSSGNTKALVRDYFQTPEAWRIENGDGAQLTPGTSAPPPNDEAFLAAYRDAATAKIIATATQQASELRTAVSRTARQTVSWSTIGLPEWAVVNGEPIAMNIWFPIVNESWSYPKTITEQRSSLSHYHIDAGREDFDGTYWDLDTMPHNWSKTEQYYLALSSPSVQTQEADQRIDVSYRVTGYVRVPPTDTTDSVRFLNGNIQINPAQVTPGVANVTYQYTEVPVYWISGSEGGDDLGESPWGSLIANLNGGDDIAGGQGAWWDTSPDYLDGGAERDYLLGFGGADTLRGGSGMDRVEGGEGADTYLFGFNDYGIDVVIDNGLFVNGYQGFWQVKSIVEHEVADPIYDYNPEDNQLRDTLNALYDGDNAALVQVISDLGDAWENEIEWDPLNPVTDVARVNADVADVSVYSLSMQLPVTYRTTDVYGNPHYEYGPRDEPALLVTWNVNGEVAGFLTPLHSDARMPGYGIDEFQFNDAVLTTTQMLEVARTEPEPWLRIPINTRIWDNNADGTWSGTSFPDEFVSSAPYRPYWLSNDGPYDSVVDGRESGDLYRISHQDGSHDLINDSGEHGTDVVRIDLPLADVNVDLKAGDDGVVVAILRHEAMEVTLPLNAVQEVVWGDNGEITKLVLNVENGPGRGIEEIEFFDGAYSMRSLLEKVGLVESRNGVRLEGGPGDDILHGGNGDDNISGADGDDRLFGSLGDDTLEGDNGSDQLNGGAGDDILDGGQGSDVLRGGAGDDVVDGGSGDDVLRGGNGDDTLDGGAGDDQLTGGPGDDALAGGDGSDVLRGGVGNDLLDGGMGDDTLDGGAGANELLGGSGDDTLIARSADSDNLLYGGPGADVYRLGPGNYTLIEEPDGAVNTVRFIADKRSGVVLDRVGDDAYVTSGATEVQIQDYYLDPEAWRIGNGRAVQRASAVSGVARPDAARSEKSADEGSVDAERTGRGIAGKRFDGVAPGKPEDAGDEANGVPGANDGSRGQPERGSTHDDIEGRRGSRSGIWRGHGSAGATTNTSANDGSAHETIGDLGTGAELESRYRVAGYSKTDERDKARTPAPSSKHVPESHGGRRAVEHVSEPQALIAGASQPDRQSSGVSANRAGVPANDNRDQAVVSQNIESTTRDASKETASSIAVSAGTPGPSISSSGLAEDVSDNASSIGESSDTGAAGTTADANEGTGEAHTGVSGGSLFGSSAIAPAYKGMGTPGSDASGDGFNSPGDGVSDDGQRGIRDWFLSGNPDANDDASAEYDLVGWLHGPAANIRAILSEDVINIEEGVTLVADGGDYAGAVLVERWSSLSRRLEAHDAAHREDGVNQAWFAQNSGLGFQTLYGEHPGWKGQSIAEASTAVPAGGIRRLDEGMRQIALT